MGVPPNRIEIISTIAGVEFQDCYSRRRIVDFGGVAVSLIDFDDLLKNKRSTGRVSDRSDVEKLEKRRRRP